MAVVTELVGERTFHIINCYIKNTSHGHVLLLRTPMKIDTLIIFTDVTEVKNQMKPSQTKLNQTKANKKNQTTPKLNKKHKQKKKKHQYKQTTLQIAVYVFWR